MRLVRLSVEHFQCIRSAELDFGRGLNVLYGPNDLGKSSLAWAIRAVLLLQHNAAAHERFVSWYGDGEPRVALTLCDDEDRYWRVTKTFGGAGSGRSHLESSKDGRTFITEVSGRQVDDKLRTMLRWGIQRPGGQGPRGFPSSFLTQVLLAEQQNVPGVLFDGTLVNDPDDSGRLRLTEALNALAQDPLFKKVVDAAQARADVAFTPTGKKRNGRGSPFVEIADQLNGMLRERDELETKVRETIAAEARVRQVGLERDELLLRLEESRAALVTAEGQLAARQRRDLLRTQLEACLTTIRSVEDLQRQIAALDEQAPRLQASIAAGEAGLATATAAAQRSEAERDRARKRLDSLAHEDIETDRRLRALGERESSAREALYQAERSVEKASESLRLARSAAAAVVQASGLASTAAQEAAAADEAVASATAEVARAQKEAELVSAERDEPPGQAVASGTEPRPDLPGADELASLRALRDELRVAEARLGGGLSVTVRPRKALTLRFTVDGQARRPAKAADETVVAAERTLAVSVADLVDIEVTAGEESARQAATKLQRRWAKQGAAVLARHGVETLEELEALCQRAEADRRAAEAALARRLQQALASAQTRRDERMARAQRLRDAAVQAATRLSDARSRASQLDPDSGQQALGAAEEARDVRKRERAALTEEIARVETERGAAISSARKAYETAEERARLDRTSVDQRGGELKILAEERTRAQAALAELRIQVAGTNLDEARRTAGALQAELSPLEGQLGALDLPDVPLLRSTVDRLAAQLRDSDTELARARGALEQVGGAVVRDRQRDLDQAIQQARDREHETEVEFDGWKLLVETLRASESAEGSHLGRALAGPVSERFRSLTRGRYGKLELGPHLQAGGLQVGGNLREIGALSAGTQDQLATLLRVCIAEQLQSAIVLDDHLSQSDPDRIAWFNAILRDAARQVQIILITCRPSEVLAPDELPAAGEPTHSGAAGLVRVVDMTKVISRFAPVTPADPLPAPG
jgi:hypothetical protein